jgi:hypothetical protein
MVPTVLFPPSVPLTTQFTAVLAMPDTVAVNCCDWLTRTVLLLGEIDTEANGVIEIVAFADAVGCARLWAVTVIEPDGIVAGAI